MRLVRSRDFVTTPWKNGGGITHEVAREDDADGLLWRLSVAEVARDGAFSLFPGLARILTVIDGPGMRLVGADGAVIAVPPLHPVRFAGDLALDGRLDGGPCRDFNLIHDPRRIDGDLRVVGAGLHREATGVLALAGAVAVGGQPVAPGDFAWTDGAATDCGAGVLALLVTLGPAG
jgi:environmental stress-induced protein Ves